MLVSFERFVFRPKKKKWKNEFVTPLLTELIKCKLATVTDEKNHQIYRWTLETGVNSVYNTNFIYYCPTTAEVSLEAIRFIFFGRKKKTRLCEK